MNRRDFLLLRAGHPAVLSCERLYMRFVDASADGTTKQLFEHLAGDLRSVTTVRVSETAWLARADLKTQLDEVLASFTARGGRVERSANRISG